MNPQQIAAELVGRLYKERKALNAETLAANATLVIALGNDYSYDYVFSRHIEGIGQKGDVLLEISTS